MSNTKSDDVYISVNNTENENSNINSKDSNQSNSTNKSESLIENSNKIDEEVDNIKKIEKKKRGSKKIIYIIILTLLIILGIIGYICYYFGVYYHATENALKYMKSTDEVKVVEQDSAYYFDGPGKDKALIFYQGAKVQEEAYAEILFKLAQKGIDGYLVKMPLNFAIFGKNKANDIIKDNKKLYNQWYIAGHSLGGAMAAMYAADHADEIDGLAMLAAYSTKKLPNKMKVVSIIGTNDKVLKWDTYNKNLINLPENYTEVKIENGNHGQFGDYGKQSGDGPSSISLEEQHEQTVKAILEKFN